MAAKFKMAAKIEFLYMNWLCGLIINITTTPYYVTVTFYLHHAENITHNTTVGIYSQIFPSWYWFYNKYNMIIEGSLNVSS